MYSAVGITSQMTLIRPASMANRHMKPNTKSSIIGWLVLAEEGAVEEDEDEDENVEGVFMGSLFSWREPVILS